MTGDIPIRFYFNFQPAHDSGHSRITKRTELTRNFLQSIATHRSAQINGKVPRQTESTPSADPQFPKEQLKIISANQLNFFYGWNFTNPPGLRYLRAYGLLVDEPLNSGNKTFVAKDDLLFPATQVGLGAKHQFEVVGLKQSHWSNATPIRKIFRDAFESAGLPYFNPHSFRKTLARFGQTTCQTPEQFKAWCQNLGHDEVMTTFISYGEVENRRQGEIIRDLATPQHTIPREVTELAKALVHEMRQSENTS